MQRSSTEKRQNKEKNTKNKSCLKCKRKVLKNRNKVVKKK